MTTARKRSWTLSSAAKLDALIRIVGGDQAEKLIKDIDEHYLREHGHAQPHGHDAEIARSAGRDVKHVAE
jgi:hypothetical protein